ncbi:chemotaxis protein CheW [Brevundimonas sp. LM2]|uniref:chemotaxis protein CheW n=1 Tax=Brevundimonas sp. LM2 TaxID=1938605 RepID=UPI000983C4E2|nr:chemotaxis protein CheW [Brevundimonas sp. LM2]AQR62535.1 chemotaxis protein CheW [Brevundimonas sp. LM2]
MSGAAEQIELISFEIGEQEYCIDVRSVREIRGWSPTTAMPQTPDYMLGVINLRGTVIPVLDLRCRLGLGPTEPSARHVIVVIEHDARTAGLLVDAVQETFQVDAGLLQAAPTMGGSPQDRLVDAVIPLEHRMLSRLVVGSLFPAEVLQVFEALEPA